MLIFIQISSSTLSSLSASSALSRRPRPVAIRLKIVALVHREATSLPIEKRLPADRNDSAVYSSRQPATQRAKEANLPFTLLAPSARQILNDLPLESTEHTFASVFSIPRSNATNTSYLSIRPLGMRD